MDLDKLIGRVILSWIITSIIALPLMFLFLNSIGKYPSISILVLAFVLVTFKTLKRR